MSDSRMLWRYLRELRPDLIVNAGAWTNVDEAELPANSDRVKAINAGAVDVIAQFACSTRTRVFHVSTASVFTGDKNHFFGADDPVNPTNYYNETKALGESICRKAMSDGANISIVRTYWLYGSFGSNFVDFVAKRALVGKSTPVVNDQWGQPTYAADVADAMVVLILNEFKSNVYHLVNTGVANRLEWAHRVIRTLGAEDNLIVPVTSNNFGAIAPRPTACVLETTPPAEACSLLPLRPWDSAVVSYVQTRYRIPGPEPA